jgi:hypothetical protein
MDRVRVWDLPSEDKPSALDAMSEITETIVDTTITYLGAFKVVRIKHYLLSHAWILLAIGCFGLLLASIAF